VLPEPSYATRPPQHSHWGRSLLLAMSLSLPTSSVAEEPQDQASDPATSTSQSAGQGVNRPFRLFRLEEAYTQEQGEWQLRLTPEYLERTERESELTGLTTIERTRTGVRSFVSTLDVEYGLTDRLELTAALPALLHADREVRVQELDDGFPTSSTTTDSDHAAIGDLSMGLAFAVLEETRLGPALTVELGLSVPTGDRSESFGSGKVVGGPALALTKSFGPFFATANLDFTFGDEFRAYGYGIGLLYLLGETGWGVAAEFEGETERSLEEDATERSLNLLPSVTYGWVDAGGRAWQLGVGVPVGLTGIAQESDTIGVALQFQVEF